jgi:hypothetical protein
VDCCEGCAEACSIFLFDSRIMGAFFGTVVGFTAMVQAVRRFECVRASVVTSVAIWCSASLAALHESLIVGSRVSFLLGCSEILLPIFGGPQPSESMLCTSLG